MSSANENSQKKKFMGTYLNFVDSTRFFTTPFSWLYLIVALAFLAIPVLLLVQGIRWEIFSWGGKLAFAFVLTVIAALAGAVLAFVVAWNGRKTNSVSKITIELIIDSIADLLGLITKAAAHFIGVFGFLAGLIALIFGEELLSMIPFGYFGGVAVMIGSLIGGYALVWISKLVKFLFAKLARIFVMVVVQVFKFVVLHAIGVIYNFIAHIIRQLFDYFFILIQAMVDYMVNGLKVVIALVARLGRFLLAYAASPFKCKELNDAKVTYNE